LDTPRQIVSKWRKRFALARLPGLEEQPRGGRPALFSPPLQRDALAIERLVLGTEHPDTLNGMFSLGTILRREGRHPESEKIYRETLPIQIRVLGPEHSDTLNSRNSLAVDLAAQGRYHEAEGLYRENRAIQLRVFGLENAYSALSTYNLACLAAVQGYRNRALALLKEAWGTDYSRALCSTLKMTPT